MRPLRFQVVDRHLIPTLQVFVLLQQLGIGWRRLRSLRQFLGQSSILGAELVHFSPQWLDFLAQASRFLALARGLRSQALGLSLGFLQSMLQLGDGIGVTQSAKPSKMLV